MGKTVVFVGLVLVMLAQAGASWATKMSGSDKAYLVTAGEYATDNPSAAAVRNEDVAKFRIAYGAGISKGLYADQPVRLVVTGDDKDVVSAVIAIIGKHRANGSRIMISPEPYDGEYYEIKLPSKESTGGIRSWNDDSAYDSYSDRNHHRSQSESSSSYSNSDSQTTGIYQRIRPEIWLMKDGKILDSVAGIDEVISSSDSTRKSGSSRESSNNSHYNSGRHYSNGSSSSSSSSSGFELTGTIAEDELKEGVSDYNAVHAAKCIIDVLLDADIIGVRSDRMPYPDPISPTESPALSAYPSVTRMPVSAPAAAPAFPPASSVKLTLSRTSRTPLVIK